ncbi:Hypothetical predicted protein [Mytilus galloprovincialis]|uniref:Uncharacterized protein n=1 Tax=Mytilus galloprovincialis TaxID=29158 RepID=A0A8B6FQ27_MYTGA|nr:Hypothetical predicted protein [Mytilus galloprovincialis]
MKLFSDKDDIKGTNSSSSIFPSTFKITSVLYGRRSAQMTSGENKIYQVNEKDKHRKKRETYVNRDKTVSANKRVVKQYKEEHNTVMSFDKQREKTSNVSTTTTTTTSSILSQTHSTNSTFTPNINISTFSTLHSNPNIGKNGTSHTEIQKMSTTTPYSITLNVTENYTIDSEPSTTAVELMTVNSSTSSSSEPNNTNDSETNGISTQSHIETVNSTTANIDSSGLSTLSSTEKGIDRYISDELSTQQSGQTNKTFDTTYQFTNTTMSHESREENILHPFTSNIDVLTVTAASASTVIVVISLIICIVLRKRKRTECKSGDVKRNGDYELAMEVMSDQTLKDWTDFRSYETPWDLDSGEYHIPSEVNNTYQTLDFTVRSHVTPKFAAENNYSFANIANINQKGDNFTKGKNTMFELKGIVDESDRNQQKTPLFYQSPSTKAIPSEETVAYCDTAIVHQEFLYDVPKNSIIDGVINPKNYFTGNQNAVATIPSKEINQLKSTRILKDKTVNAMDSFKEKLNMSLSKKLFRQPNAYPMNPFPPSDTEIYSFAK